MDLVILNDSRPRRLAFYLAEEEYLARRYPDRDFFFAWQVKPSVIVGRNQLLQKEINLEFCREHGVDVVRRKSGGGAVVADMNNVMLSYITSSDDVRSTFSEYTSMVAAALRALGLDASDNSRNDILIGRRKVSGNAYYHLPGRSIVHGTMLFDYDPILMSNTLRPSQSKLASHGVESVRSRVTTIREHIPDMTIDRFIEHILNTVPKGGKKMILSEEDIQNIESIEQGYYESRWLDGKNPRGAVSHREHIVGIGEIGVDVTLTKGLIESVVLTGDFLENTDAESVISNALKGVPYDRESISSVLMTIDFNKLITGMTVNRFVDLLF